ncbi:MAG: hypothetical protein DRP13_03335 [Candidatus Aenigmatarchaeota archaeon]|nr:MAG: hypothetical protein DRP13_03335 [Candidatus Aenigmarchaeota archaeon]
MVFARTKLMMEDNCFEEDPGRVYIKFVGPGVTKLYSKMYELMKSVFRVSDADIQEVEYAWGKGEKGEKFNIRWWLHKDMDIFSYLYIKFSLTGEGTEKKGVAKITIRGLLRTEYPQDTVWQRSLFYELLRTMWHRIFYHKKREEYAEECRHSIILFERKVKEYWEALKKEIEGA